MSYLDQAVSSSVMATNKLIRNTYILLSMTLAFSAAMAGLAMYVNAPPMGWLALIPMIVLLFAVKFTQETPLGLLFCFAFTGFMGYMVGPVIDMYLALESGAQIVMSAMGTTAAAFLGLSGYALTTRKDFSYMGGFLFVGLIVLLCAMILNIFMAIPGLSLAISSIAVMIFSGYILYDTSEMVHGGETNYISATISLYLDILNLFLHLLNIIAAFTGND